MAACSELFDYNKEDSTDNLEEALVLAAQESDARCNEMPSTSASESIFGTEDDTKAEEFVRLDSGLPDGSRKYLKRTREEEASGSRGIVGLDGSGSSDVRRKSMKRTREEEESGSSSIMGLDGSGSSDVRRKSLKRTHEEEESGSSSIVGLGGSGYAEVGRKSLKRGREEDESGSKNIRTNEGQVFQKEDYTKVVASHYNALEEKGLDERSKSRILYMRNFHNWIKSMLINEYLTKIKDSKKHNSPLRVLDMCCGKGGDLLKWRKGNITHLICSDIASVSLDQCSQRYNDMKNRNHRNDRGPSSIYTIEYIAGDCSRVRLREKYKDPSMKLDLVSCQFAFHYSFESLPQAECMIRNASECLQPGGFFIGTIPDANDLVARAHKANSSQYGNDVYQVQFDCDVDKPPLFGAKYHFHLDGVVDCPEFLVHFPTLIKLARKFGLKFVKKEKFYDYFEQMKNEGRQLMTTMRSLEVYPPHESATLVGTSHDDYTHAKEFLRRENRPNLKLGTLSKSEWEASSLYMLFVFEKVKNTWNADGTPCYIFN